MKDNCKYITMSVQATVNDRISAPVRIGAPSVSMGKNEHPCSNKHPGCLFTFLLSSICCLLLSISNIILSFLISRLLVVKVFGCKLSLSLSQLLC